MKNLEQGSLNVYSISEYKSGAHGQHDAIHVKAKSGEVFKILKRANNVGDFSFFITDDVYRASKKSVINYLKKH